MGTEHSGYCRKEKEIAEMHTKLTRIEKIVMGNGKEGLDVQVPLILQTVGEMKGSLDGLKKGFRAFVQAQYEQEGRDAGKAEIRKRTRWTIGILIGLITTLLGSLIYAIHQIAQMNTI